MCKIVIGYWKVSGGEFWKEENELGLICKYEELCGREFKNLKRK